MFRIALHKDDRKVIEDIKSIIGCGRLNTERDTLIFTISQLSDRPINKSLLPAKPATTGLQGNPVVLLLYRKPQKSEIFGAASQDGGLLLTGGKGLFKGLLLTGGKGPLALRERRSTALHSLIQSVLKIGKIYSYPKALQLD